MAESGEAAHPQAIVVAASQPGNLTALVARPPKPSKDQVKALVAGAPEMFKWTSARVVKLMEFLVKDDEELFYGFDEPTTWRAWRACLVPKQRLPSKQARPRGYRAKAGGCFGRQLLAPRSGLYQLLHLRQSWNCVSVPPFVTSDDLRR